MKKVSGVISKFRPWPAVLRLGPKCTLLPNIHRFFAESRLAKILKRGVEIQVYDVDIDIRQIRLNRKLPLNL